MSLPPHDIYVYRHHSWTMLKSDRLLPGDLVSIVRNASEDICVPCDILLLNGGCIVNEAMLSGESTPLMKESVALQDDLLPFHLKSSETKIHTLFGGTKILQHTPENTLHNWSSPPDGGCVGYVLRTGFGTLSLRFQSFTLLICD